MARGVVASLTHTRLDFANSVLTETSGSNIDKLQRVQNCLARVVLRDNYNLPACFLSHLHWLPVNKQINFKITTFTDESVAFGQPTYLSAVLTPHQPQRSLHSVNQNLLHVPHFNSRFGQRSFSYCAPKIWNDIPLSVRQSLSLDSFKHNLKTHDFANNWPPGDCLQRLRFNILIIVRFTNRCEWMNEWMKVMD